jgi:hypothetical protein
MLYAQMMLHESLVKNGSGRTLDHLMFPYTIFNVSVIVLLLLLLLLLFLCFVLFLFFILLLYGRLYHKTVTFFALHV